MILKPKKSNLNEPAILFKRYTVPENAAFIRNIANIYKTDYLIYVPSSQEDADSWVQNNWSSSGLTNIDGRFIWTDGVDYYYSKNADQYYYDRATNAWLPMTWNFAGGQSVNISGRYIWTDGTNIYYNSSAPYDYSFYLDKATKTWYPKSWNGLSYFDGSNIWHRGNDIYYSDGSNQYKLDVDTDTWSAYTWTGLTNFDGTYIWNVGDTYYYSGASDMQYKLESGSSNWQSMSWNVSFDRSSIWNIGDKYYLSDYSQYELDTNTRTWIPKVWNNYDNISGVYVNEIDGKYYYMRLENQYVLSAERYITQYWKFNSQTLNFELVDYEDLEQIQKDNIVEYTPTEERPLVYVEENHSADTYYLVLVNQQTSWVKTHYSSISEITTQYELLSARISYNDKQYGYTKNIYYNAGCYDYVVTGSIDKSTGQLIKGLMTPTTAQTIRIDEDVPADEEDLIVFDGHLYGIESLEISQKKMPRPFNITYLTLNNIL